MDSNSLSHTKWNCKYHIVFAPKYRRKVAYGKIKQDIASIQIIYKERNSSDKEVTLSGAKFSIFPIQYMKNDELVWENGFKDS